MLNTEGEVLHRTVQALLQQGVVIYPTETLYALGCAPRSLSAIDRVLVLKGRPKGKPLPVIIGDMDQISQVCTQVRTEVWDLAESLWPGPLSILLPGRRDLSKDLKDAGGWISVRWTPHPLARELCRQAGGPLVATSANLSGHQPAARPEDLDQDLVDQVDALLPGPPLPGGGLPSTVVRIRGRTSLEILRQGAISMPRLQTLGWKIYHSALRDDSKKS